MGYCMIYVFMQTFAVPGTVSLSLLGGALYGSLYGLLLVSGKHGMLRAPAAHELYMQMVHFGWWVVLWHVFTIQLMFTVISTLGATACYGMSWLCGKRLVYAIWPGRLASFAAEVSSRKSSLLSYVVLLRVTPVLPNTFINVASPMVGVPLAPYMLGESLSHSPAPRLFVIQLLPVSCASAVCQLQLLPIVSENRIYRSEYHVYEQ